MIIYIDIIKQFDSRMIVLHYIIYVLVILLLYMVNKEHNKYTQNNSIYWNQQLP